MKRTFHLYADVYHVSSHSTLANAKRAIARRIGAAKRVRKVGLSDYSYTVRNRRGAIYSVTGFA